MQNFVSKALSGLSCMRLLLASAVVLLSAELASAQTDYSALTAGLDTEISGAKPILLGIGATVLAVAVVFVIYKFVKRMLSN